MVTNKAKESWKVETPFQNFALKELNKLTNVVAYNIHGAGYQEEGIPDILASVEGRFVGLELKATNGHASMTQRYQLERIKATGGYGAVVFNWSDILSVLREVRSAVEEV